MAQAAWQSQSYAQENKLYDLIVKG